MPILAEGADEAQRINEELKAGRGTFWRPENWKMAADDPSGFFRFATERNRILTFEVHRFATPKPKPDECDWDKWPKSVSALCPNGKAFRLRDSAGNLTDEYEEGYGDCWIHANRLGIKEGPYKKDAGQADTMTYGLIVPQKVITASGKPWPEDQAVTGFTDETVEYTEKDGKKVSIPKLMIATQRYSNFWHQADAASFMPPRTIRNKVYGISRDDKNYTIQVVHTDQDAETAGKRYDEALEIVGFNLSEYLLETATRDFYRKFFIPGELPEGGYGRKDSGDDEDGASADSSKETAPATPPVDAAAMEAFGARLRGRGAKASSN